jgi:hypothetical protein
MVAAWAQQLGLGVWVVGDGGALGFVVR